jgi:membrane associated rhomboid family serine protease
MFNLPTIVLASILVLIGIHALRVLVLSDADDLGFALDWAVVPARWTAAYWGVQPDDILNALSAAGTDDERLLQVQLARYVLADGDGKPWTAITYAFLHGSWTHVLLNCVWLAAFGTPVARRCGAIRYAVLALATAIGGAVAHVIMHPYQPFPLVGASAAVSGMMAAAAWFIFAPATWLLQGRLAEPHERPREALVDLVRNQRVLIFLAVWFASNFISGILAQPLGLTDASVAWEAHVGGFLVGLVLFPFLDPINPRPTRRSLNRT